LEAETSAEAEGMAGAMEDAGASEPGALAGSVASPELAEETGLAEEATGALLEAAGAATPPPLEKSTTAGPGQVNV
jgi:hypothetical protein